MLLLYTLCHWAHVTTRSSEHTLLFQVWSKIQASESYFISETVIAQLFVQPQEISRAIIQNTIQWQFSVSDLEPADILLRIRTQAQNFTGQEPAKPQAREGQLLQLPAKEGISWRITRSILSTQKTKVKSCLKYHSDLANILKSSTKYYLTKVIAGKGYQEYVVTKWTFNVLNSVVF